MWQDIFYSVYPEDSDLRRLLLQHSNGVMDKALSLWIKLPSNLAGMIEKNDIICGAMLHDIGVRFCYAPSICCTGSENYMRHGIIGGDILRHSSLTECEKFARICERHTGSGLTAQEIKNEKLPLPEKDYVPESLLEKLIAYSDKFFSKSGDLREKSFEEARKSIARFGQAPLARFDEMYKIFGK